MEVQCGDVCASLAVLQMVVFLAEPPTHFPPSSLHIFTHMSEQQ